jgi:hypothetical protein
MQKPASSTKAANIDDCTLPDASSRMKTAPPM